MFEVLVGEHSYSGPKHFIKTVSTENTWNPSTPALYLSLDGDRREAGCLEQKKKAAPCSVISGISATWPSRPGPLSLVSEFMMSNII